MRFLISIAASLALISLVVAAIALARSFEDREPAAMERLRSEVADLRGRLDQAESGIRLHAGKIERVQATAGGSTAPGDPGAGAGPERAERAEVAAAVQAEVQRLHGMIEALQGQIQDLERRIHAGPVPEAATALPTETEEQRQAAALENQSIALDEARDLQERVRSLRILRSLDARSLEVTRAMIRLIGDPQVPPRIRADIIRNLHKVTLEELKNPLLHAVTIDPDPEVRSEAAESLDAFLNDPQVAQTLQFVKENDPHEGVRREAAMRLEAFERPPGEGGR